MSGHDDRSDEANDTSERDRPPGAGRRVRVDATPAAARISPPPAPVPVPPWVPGPAAKGVSGRLSVVVFVLGVLALWGGLNVAFRLWRSGYRERAAYGQARVVEALGPLAEVVPTGDVDPAAWRQAVAETRAMLGTLTAANLLTRDDMTALGASIDARVARITAHPDTARDELAGLWDDAERNAGPIIIRHHPRPRLLRLPARQARETRSGERGAVGRTHLQDLNRYEFPM